MYEVVKLQTKKDKFISCCTRYEKDMASRRRGITEQKQEKGMKKNIRKIRGGRYPIPPTFKLVAELMSKNSWKILLNRALRDVRNRLGLPRYTAFYFHRPVAHNGSTSCSHDR